jgi:hypothetical protein
MNTNELRIGNWVNDRDGKPIKITSIVTDYLNDIVNVQVHSGYYGDGALEGTDVDNLFPIILTPEILLKAGFTNETFYYEKDEICIREIEGKFYALAMWVPIESETNTLIESVHYLQNFYFFIIGRELNI